MGHKTKQKLCLFYFLFILLELNHVQTTLLLINDDYINSNYLQDVKQNEKIHIGHNKQLSLIDLQIILSNDRYLKSIEISGLNTLFNKDSNLTKQNVNLIELFYPHEKYGDKHSLEKMLISSQLDLKKFNLKFLNMSSNNLEDQFLEGYSFDSIKSSHSTLYDLVLKQYFSRIKVLKLSHNKFSNLKRGHFELFAGNLESTSNLEMLLLDFNEIKTIRHDAFYDLKSLKFLDLSSNNLKLIHPLTFSAPYFTSNLVYLNLKYNKLKALFSGLNGTLESLTHLYIDQNEDLKCDCGLEWLLSRRLVTDFVCPSENYCLVGNKPNLVTDNSNLDESSDISIIRKASKRWFAWTVFVDHLPPLIPFPYFISNETRDQKDLIEELENQEKHVYHTWLFNDAILKCTNKNQSEVDESGSTIIWKTQYGYFSYFDNGDVLEDETNLTNQTNYNSFKIFYKFNKLTKIYKSQRIRISDKLSAASHSTIYVTPENHLVITNMRQLVSGPFVCLSINENGIKSYEYNILVRTGVSEYFIYSLFVSVISMIVPSIIGLIICCICEYQADKHYPMTPPCYPTPLVSTPPNFDFNEWMANAASYFPNLNIHDTLEQVSKRLRKGMEKASVTVKSLGMTSSAYIYSMYEQSSQRFYDLKQYVPNINVPSINLSLNLPSMRYAPMGQLANRMRAGMGNMFIQFREFCGSSDLTHTPSIVDIQADCSASNAIGKTYIIDQFNIKDGTRLNQSNFYRFLHLIKEESKLEKSEEGQMDEITEYSVVAEEDENQIDYSKPCTSGLNKDKLYPSLGVIHNSDIETDDDLDHEVKLDSKSSPILVSKPQIEYESQIN